MKATPEYKEEFLEKLGENTVIHVNKPFLNKRLCKLFDDLGFKWPDGSSFTDSNSWCIYRDETCYRITDKDRNYSDMETFKEHGFSITTCDEVLSWFEEDEVIEAKKKSNNFKSMELESLAEKENKMTYAEQQLEKIQELDDSLHFDDYIHSTGKNITFKGDGLDKIWSKENYLKFRAWADKMFSPVESEE